MKLLILLTIAALAAGQGAYAEISSKSIADTLAAQGFTHIELREGPSQIKVEAIRGTEKVETIYDKSTGGVLKTETASVGLFDDTRAGVSLRERNSDFVRTSAGGGNGSGSGRAGSSSGGADDGANHDVGDDHGGLRGGMGGSGNSGSGGSDSGNSGSGRSGGGGSGGGNGGGGNGGGGHSGSGGGGGGGGGNSGSGGGGY